MERFTSRSNFDSLLVRLFGARHIQRAHQPRDYHLLENHRIGPYASLPPQVPALRVDPGFFWNVAGFHEQEGVGDGDLRIESAGDDEHLRSWLAEKILIYERHLGKHFREIVNRLGSLENIQEGRDQAEQIFAVAEYGGLKKFLLKAGVHRRGLQNHAPQARALCNRKLGGPVGAEALAVSGDARFVYFGAREDIINHRRKHAFGGHAGFDGSLARAWRIDGDESDAVGDDLAEIFGEFLFAA